ncbi:MAG: winged helix-turn-helix domain-containing protein [Pyrinomonadaceae bacterium]
MKHLGNEKPQIIALNRQNSDSDGVWTLNVQHSAGSLEQFITNTRRKNEKGNKQIELSAMEFKLLQYLIEHRGEVLKRDELLDEVWGYNAMPSTRTVDVHIAWLRQKLEENPHYPNFIQTVHGLGYKFVG